MSAKKKTRGRELRPFGTTRETKGWYPIPVTYEWHYWFPWIDVDGDMVYVDSTGSPAPCYYDEGRVPPRILNATDFPRKKWRKHFLDTTVEEFEATVIAVEHLREVGHFEGSHYNAGWMRRCKNAYNRAIAFEGIKVSPMYRQKIRSCLKRLADVVIFSGLSEKEPEFAAWLMEQTKGMESREEMEV